MNNSAPLVDQDRTAAAVAVSFPTPEEVELLGRIGLFSSDDARALRKLWRLFQNQTDDYLDLVLGMVAAYPALAAALALVAGDRSENSTENSTALRKLFRRWLYETCLSPQKPEWLLELYAELPPGPSMPELLTRLPDFRYLIALSFPLLATANTLLIGNRVTAQDSERMQSAFLKSILLQVILLSKLYVKEGLW